MFAIICFMINVKELRNRLGLTQEQFAKKLDVVPITIRRWEKGQGKMHLGNKKRLEQLAKQVKERIE